MEITRRSSKMAAPVSATTLDEVVGCPRYDGKPKSIAQMKRAKRRKLMSRRDRGRH